MNTHVEARCVNGVPTPQEPLDQEEGAEISVSFEEVQPPKEGLAAVVEMVDRLRESYPPDMWDGLPTDLAMSKNHCIYGDPKEAE